MKRRILSLLYASLAALTTFDGLAHAQTAKPEPVPEICTGR